MKKESLLNLRDYERTAEACLPRPAYDYYAGGALDEITLAENRNAWSRMKLHYRVLAGVGERQIATTVLGRPVSMPILVAPTAFQRMACEAGETATARATKRAQTLYILSCLSNTDMETVFAEADSPKWFQLYVYKDRELTRSLIERAEAAGAEALVLTVDSIILGTRERDVRNGFQLPQGLSVKNVAAAGKGKFPEVQGSGLAAYVNTHFDSALSWDYLDWLCANTSLPVVVKGLCRGDDARRCVEHGARAVIVSNHGGRQLDTCPATAEVLPHVVAALDGACEVYVDGGIRRGSDVLKALALGARAVLLGRPILWGLAAAGEEGALAVLELLRREFSDAMALVGCTTLADIGPELLNP
ncbi:MAG: alpha-hydroxy acid oxidase [Gammaproteobacteria bacterium]